MWAVAVHDVEPLYRVFERVHVFRHVPVTLVIMSDLDVSPSGITTSFGVVELFAPGRKAPHLAACYAFHLLFPFFFGFFSFVLRTYVKDYKLSHLGYEAVFCCEGLEQVLDSKRYNEIIITRATVPVGEDIGFLPGTEEEKILWIWARM